MMLGLLIYCYATGTFSSRRIETLTWIIQIRQAARRFPRACGNMVASEYSRMDFSKWKSMDPHLLVGLVNTELRNHSESLEDLVKTHDLPVEDLKRKLAEAGYEYRTEQNQFR